MSSKKDSNICLACESLKEEIESLAPEDLILRFYPIGLHESPTLLNQTLQHGILGEGCGRNVILAYGLCSGSTVGLFNPAGNLVLPRFHDCIRLLRRPGVDEAGSYFLSPSWVRYGRTPLHEREQLVKRYGKETGAWIFETMYRHYRRIIFIDTMDSGEAVNEPLALARETAGQLQWDFKVEQGAAGRLERLLKGHWDSPDYLVLPPGRKVEESMFF